MIMEKHIERKPLFFTETRRKQLESYLSGFTFLRRLKWNTNKSFVTFLIGALPFKVVTAPNRSVDITKVVYYNDCPRCGWVINAYTFHLSSPSIIKAIRTICDLMDKYDSLDTYMKIQDIAKRNNLDPMILRHKCFEVKGEIVLDIPDSETGKRNKMVTKLTDKTIEELHIEADRYGATYYIIKNIAMSFIADTLCGLKPSEDGFNIWDQIRNDYPVEY